MYMSFQCTCTDCMCYLCVSCIYVHVQYGRILHVHCIYTACTCIHMYNVHVCTACIHIHVLYIFMYYVHVHVKYMQYSVYLYICICLPISVYPICLLVCTSNLLCVGITPDITESYSTKCTCWSHNIWTNGKIILYKQTYMYADSDG